MFSWFLPELWIDYFILISSIVWMYLSFKILYKFKATLQFTSWMLIFASMCFFFSSELAFIFSYTSFEDFSVYGLFPTDLFWYVSYILFGIGALNYSSILRKKLKKSFSSVDFALIMVLCAVFFFASMLVLSFDLVTNLVFALHVSLGSFATFSCIPVISLLRGNPLARQWFTISGAMSFFLISVVFYTLELSFSISFPFSSLAGVISSLMLCLGFYNILTAE